MNLILCDKCNDKIDRNKEWCINFHSYDDYCSEEYEYCEGCKNEILELIEAFNEAND